MTRTPTDEALLEMLRESTGTHFLDSGGEGGRHWQQNRHRDLEHEPPAVVSFRGGEISYTYRLFHWLRDRLEIDVEATDAFDDAFLRECDPDNDHSWEELREAFPDWYARFRSIADTRETCTECEGQDQCEMCGGTGEIFFEDYYAARGIYGEGEPITINSYNEENLLDQVILFTYVELRAEDETRRGEPFVILQIHGGSDVRGGYTRPRVFRLRDDELAVFDFRSGTIVCADDGHHEWITDDGRHWYFQGACGRGAGTRLETYERRTLAEDGAHVAEDEVSEWIRGTLCVTGDGDGLCPLCRGKLEAG